MFIPPFSSWPLRKAPYPLRDYVDFPFYWSVVNFGQGQLLAWIWDVGQSSTFVNVLANVAMIDEIFDLSLLLVAVIHIMAMLPVEEVILIFIMKGGRLQWIGLLQILFSLDLYQNLGSKDERDVVVRSAGRVPWFGTLSAR